MKPILGESEFQTHSSRPNGVKLDIEILNEHNKRSLHPHHKETLIIKNTHLEDEDVKEMKISNLESIGNPLQTVYNGGLLMK